MNLNISIPDNLYNQFSPVQIQNMVEQFLKKKVKMKNDTKNPAQFLLKDIGILKDADFSDISEDDIYLQED